MREEQAITPREPDSPTDLMARFADTARRYIPVLRGGRPIGEGADKRRRGLKPERFGCLKIDNEIEFGRLYNWEGVT